MENLKFINFLKSVAPISSEDAELISSHFQKFSVDKGQLILKSGEISKEYFYLQEGLLRAYLYNIDGDEITTEFHTENNIAFEIASFFSQTPSEVNIEAITNIIAYKIDFQHLNKLFHSLPAFREVGRAILVREFIASKKRNYAMINQTAEFRYKNLLINQPQIIKYAPLKHIASYLGITDSTLSRIRGK